MELRRLSSLYRLKNVGIGAFNSAFTCAIASLANTIWAQGDHSWSTGWLERFLVGYCAVLVFIAIFTPILIGMTDWLFARPGAQQGAGPGNEERG